MIPYFLRVIALAAAFFFCCQQHALAHDFWVEAIELPRDDRLVLEVQIGGGHYFPRSETALNEKLVHSLKWHSPKGESVPLEVRTEGNFLRAETILDEPTGGYVELVVKNPRHDTTSYIARGVVVSSTEQGPFPQSGSETGLVMLGESKDVLAGETVALALYLDDQAKEASFTVYPENLSPLWLKASTEAPAELKIVTGTRYLVTTHAGKTTHTLTFKSK